MTTTKEIAPLAGKGEDNLVWLERLQMLCNRFSHLGIRSDLSALSLNEAWGLYRFLSRLADG